MTKTQAQALANFVSRLRLDAGMPPWDVPLILAALEEAVPTADAWEVGRALIELSRNDKLRSPKPALAQPGAHWTRPDGTRTARRGDHDVRCADHPHRTMPCPECRRGVPCPPDVAAQVREQIRAGQDHHHKRANERAERSRR